MRPLIAVIRREYLQRVRNKWFILTTVGFPFLMIALMAIPIVISEQRDILAIIKEPSETVTMIGAIAGSVFLIGVGSWLYLCGKGSRVQG